MKLIKTPSYEGYYLEDIKKELKPMKLEEFNRWYTGQTGVIHKDKLLVYKWDYDRFLAGLDPLD